MNSDSEEWNKSVSHPLQSWEWGDFRKNRQPISRVNGMLVIWSRIKYTPWYFGYIPMGKYPDKNDIQALTAEGKRTGAIGVRLEPNVLKTGNLTGFNELTPGRHLFKPKTYLIDLTCSEEELLKNMHPKGRYNIKVARKHGVTVKENNSQDAFDRYLNLLFSGTTKRQGIYSHGRDYHQQLWNTLKGNMAHLFVAEYKGETITADIVFEFKNQIYYAYSASKLEYREVMAPTLLVWEIMLWGKSRGCTNFDLWGAEDGKGFSRFKEQFGGVLTENAGTFDLPLNKLLYPIFRFAEEARWKILRLLK